MYIQLKKHRNIGEVQLDFNRQFPYLKIEFFANPHQNGAPSPKSKMIGRDKTLGQISQQMTEGEIDISGNRSVADVENEFWERYGLSVQVFRKSGRSWIETSLTDKWTLDRQNMEGEETSAHHPDLAKYDPEFDALDRDKYE